MSRKLIYVQIFHYLDSFDLLQLARTNKPFRVTLMSRRTAEPFWKAAHARVKYLPLIPCPPFLSEPQLADLAFGRDCHTCGKKAEYPFHYLGCKARYCDACIRSMCVPFLPAGLSYV